ncbi:MAG: DNA translocase FtsK [Chitinophagia bacterium]|nr:DNA translocase FtsK [Chitinophagia bacterium]
MPERKGRRKQAAEPPLTAEKEPEAALGQMVRDKRTHKIVGASLIFLSFFLVVAICSHLFNWQKDQDVVRQLGMRILLPNAREIGNMLGTFGAFVSHLLVYEGFGIASILFAGWSGCIGVNLLLGYAYFPIRRVVLRTGLIILWLSICLSLTVPGTGFHWGGELGDAMCMWLEGVAGFLGTATLLLLIGLCIIIWQFDPDFTAIRMPSFRESRTEASDEAAVATPPVAPDSAEVSPIAADMEGKGLRPVPSGVKLRIVASEPEPDEGLTLVEHPGPESNASSLKPVPDPYLVPLAPTSEPTVQPATPTGKRPSEAEASRSTEQLALRINNPIDNPVDPVPDARDKVAQLPPYDPVLDLRNYRYPTLDLLEQYAGERVMTDAVELNANKVQIERTLENYSIAIKDISATVGPTVTLYEVVPADGVRIARIRNLEDDIALSLAALGIRIIAPIPGKGAIGIEVPNVKKSIVGMRSLLASDKFQNSRHALPIALGKTIDNELFIVDLATMPHLLMAGATGQGKSVGINAVLTSLLYKKHPSQLKFVLVDPKKVELSLYTTIEKHFLAKLPGEEDAIITDTRKVVNTLNALCIEMDTRYDLLKEAGCRNIREYNEKFVNRRLNPQKGHQFLPFIVLVIDEFADLIMTAGKEIEMPIARLAQLARAVGIHLVIATQRPSVNIITGTIKANFPARIAFKVSSRVDSRTILDTGGAEQLIGRGDMLVSYNGELTRVQCVFVDTPEVERLVDFIGAQQGYPQAFLLPEYVDEKEMEGREVDLGDRDSYFEEAARLIVQNNMGSTSLLQRRLKLGYNRAGRLMDQLEAAGIVGPNLGSKAREVLFRSESELEAYLETLR